MAKKNEKKEDSSNISFGDKAEVRGDVFIGNKTVTGSAQTTQPQGRAKEEQPEAADLPEPDRKMNESSGPDKINGLASKLAAILAVFVGTLVVVVLAFAYLARQMPNEIGLALIIVAVVLVLVLLLAASLMTVRVFSPETGERLFRAVISALPLVGRIVGVDQRAGKTEEED